MDYEYIEDVAEQLNVDGDGLQEVIDQLKIKTVQLAVPPYGVELSTAVDPQDAERLRSYFAVKPRFSENSETSSCRHKKCAAA